MVNAEIQFCKSCWELVMEKGLALTMSWTSSLLWKIRWEKNESTNVRRACEMPFSEQNTAIVAMSSKQLLILLLVYTRQGPTAARWGWRESTGSPISYYWTMILIDSWKGNHCIQLCTLWRPYQTPMDSSSPVVAHTDQVKLNGSQNKTRSHRTWEKGR